MRNLASLTVLLLAAAACDEASPCLASFEEAGGPEVACTDASSGVTDRCYDPAQICPDISPLNMCSHAIGTETSYNILLLNRGTQPYKLLGLQVRGDTACAVKELRSDPPVGAEVAGGDAAIVNFKFAPVAGGDSHLTLEVTTDAENFPTLFVPFCGRGTDAEPQPGDECLACQDTSTAEVSACGS